MLTYAARMHLIPRTDAPTFDADGTSVVAYAAPSRGSSEVSLWQVELAPGSTSPRHHMNREEVFLGLYGQAIAEIYGPEHRLGAGDCLILSAGTDFTLHVPGRQPFRAVACMPLGAQAPMPPGDVTFVPPWGQGPSPTSRSSSPPRTAAWPTVSARRSPPRAATRCDRPSASCCAPSPPSSQPSRASPSFSASPNRAPADSRTTWSPSGTSTGPTIPPPAAARACASAPPANASAPAHSPKATRSRTSSASASATPKSNTSARC